MAKIIVTGTPGSGKSTLLSKIKTKVKITTLSEEILKFTSKEGVADRDRIRYMSYEEVAGIRRKIIEKFNTIKDDMLIDTHITVKRGTKYIPGFSTADLDAFKGVCALIYVDAHANEIMFRRLTDKTRTREEEPEEEIHEQRRINVSLAAYFASHLDVPLYIIKNRQGMIEKAVEETDKAIKEALGKK